MATRKSTSRGFTLMELLVVIALIALLITVMVPVMLSFMKGRGLAMIGNNIAGFFAFARSEAMNRRQTHAIVYYYDEEILPTGGLFEQKAGPGMVLYRITTNPLAGEEQITYVRQLDFIGGMAGSVDFAGGWKSKVSVGPIARLGDAANDKFRGKYRIALFPDGMLQFYDDKPSFALDQGNSRHLMTDLVLTDGDRFVFMDINAATGGLKRSGIISSADTDMTP